jgi:hypothetical protein
VLAADEVPHLVELDLGDGQVARRVAVDLLGRGPRPA